MEDPYSIICTDFMCQKMKAAIAPIGFSRNSFRLLGNNDVDAQGYHKDVIIQADIDLDSVI